MKKGMPQTVAYWLPDNGALFDYFTDQSGPYTFVNAADYGDDIVQTLCEIVPNVLLLEPDPNRHECNVELVRRVRMWPKLPVKCVALVPGGASWFNAFHPLDISGEVCTDHLQEELVNWLSAISHGYRFLSPCLRKRADNQIMATIHSPKPDGVLTSREYEVVELIATGYTNKEIVERLFISVKTVETHKFNVVHKLELSSTCELRQWVRQKRVV